MNHRIVVNEPTVNGQRHFGVVFEDGTRTDYSVSTVDELKARLAADSDRLDKAAALTAIPVDATVDLTPVPVPPPTKDEADRAAYFKAVAVLAQLRQVFKAGDPELIAQETLVKSLYKPEYYDAVSPVANVSAVGVRRER